MRIDALGATCAAIALAACAAPPDFVGRAAEPIAWPSPTASPRVDFEFAYRGSQDVVRHPGFLTWLSNIVAGEDDVSFVAPSGLATATPFLWIADSGAACVHRVSFATGEHARFTGGPLHRFHTPVGIAAGPDGHVYVTDAASGHVVILDPSGDCIHRFGGLPILERPTGVCFDARRQRLLVVDTVGCRLVMFDAQGRHLDTIGGRGSDLGQFNYPTHLAQTSDGGVVVVDSMNFRVQVLSPDLRPLRVFGQVGRGPGDFANPKGVAIDSHDHIYVVDSMFDNYQIFDIEGRLLLAVSSSGSGLGNLYLPTGIHIDPSDRIYVSDAGNSRIQVMRLHGGAR